MRNSGHDADDAGDASSSEIGHVAYLPSRTMYRYNTACAILPNPGLARAKRESGEGTLAGSPTDPRLEQCMCNATPDLRYRARVATIAFCQPAAGTATNESDLAHGKRRSGILCQALFRADFTVVSIRRGMQKHTQGKHACSTADGLTATTAPKTKASPTLVRVTGRSIKQPPPGVCSQPSVAWSYFPKLYKSDQSLMP